MQKSTIRGAMDFHTALRQFDTHLVKRHFAMIRRTFAAPLAMRWKSLTGRMPCLTEQVSGTIDAG
jgi:hypothetical protein